MRHFSAFAVGTFRSLIDFYFYLHSAPSPTALTVFSFRFRHILTVNLGYKDSRIQREPSQQQKIPQLTPGNFLKIY